MKAKILENRVPFDKKPLVLKKLPDPYPKGYESIINIIGNINT